MDGAALEGVTLEQYAGVAAAIDEELPLDAVLAAERIDPPAWRAADAAWKARLAGDTPSGPVFSAYVKKRAEAEDWLGREVSPLGDDLGAWIAFLAAYGAHHAPFELLSGAGMRLADLARLGRRWARRFEGDASLEKKAAELIRKGAGPLPKITVGSAAIRPFPWSPGPAAPAPPLEPEGGAEAFAEAAELPLDRYAALRAEFAQPGADRERVVARYGLLPARFAILDEAFRERLARGGEMERDYRRLFAYQRSRLRAAAKFEPRDPKAPLPALTGTSLALDVPRGPALPFVEGEAPDEIAVGDENDAADERPRPVGLGGTSLALDVPRGPALPFGADGAPVPVAPAPPPLSLVGTSLALDVPRAAPLPFAKAMMFELPEHLRSLPLPAEPPALTIEQYASLCVELAEAPARVGETLARYRLTQADRERVDRAFQDRFAREPGLRDTWERASATYRAWLVAQGR